MPISNKIAMPRKSS